MMKFRLHYPESFVRLFDQNSEHMTVVLSYGMGCPSMQRVPKPGASSRAFNNFCMLVSAGASSLKHIQHTSLMLVRV